MKCGNLANLHDPAMYAERVEPCSDYIIDYCCKNSPTYLGGWEAHITPAIYMRGSSDATPGQKFSKSFLSPL